MARLAAAAALVVALSLGGWGRVDSVQGGFACTMQNVAPAPSRPITGPAARRVLDGPLRHAISSHVKTLYPLTPCTRTPPPPAAGAAADNKTTAASLAPQSTSATGARYWKDPVLAAKANNLTAFSANLEAAGLGKTLGTSDLVATTFAPSERRAPPGW